MIDPYSAGTQPKRIDPLAIQAMAEVGIDIADQPSKSIIDVEYIPFDYMVTVCSDAHEVCPVFPGHAKVLHIGFDDPPLLAAQDTPENALKHYRRVRDEIRVFVEQLPKA